MKNEGFLDRLIRFLLGGLALIAAYLWIGGVFSIVLYAIGGIFIFTAATGFCLLYKPIHFNTLTLGQGLRSWIKITMSVLILAILGGATYGSLFLTKKFFLEDYNHVNNFYKQTLFLTGQNQRPEALKNYNQLVTSFTDFKAKYSAYKPHSLKDDKQLNTDLEKAASIILGLKETVTTGDLAQAHTGFEEVRPIFQSILKRNGFSMLAVALVDFHDAMETILTPANAKDAGKTLAMYTTVDQKLKEVEAIANDEEIQTIRNNLETLKLAAQDRKSEELPRLADTLKSSYVMVYLKRG